MNGEWAIVNRQYSMINDQYSRIKDQVNTNNQTLKLIHLKTSVWK